MMDPTFKDCHPIICFQGENVVKVKTPTINIENYWVFFSPYELKIKTYDSVTELLSQAIIIYIH